MEFRDLKKQYEVLKPEIDAAVTGVIDSAQFISGLQVKELEQELTDYVGVKHCITCANGTDAITLALKVWQIVPAMQCLCRTLPSFPAVNALRLKARPAFL